MGCLLLMFWDVHVPCGEAPLMRYRMCMSLVISLSIVFAFCFRFEDELSTLQELWNMYE